MRVRRMRIAAGFLFAASAFLATATAADDLAAAIREAKVREAAFRSVEAALAVLAQDAATAESLAERMLADPHAYADPEVARARIAGEERAALHAAFREQLGTFARARSEELPANWVDDVVRDEAARVEEAVERLVGDSVDSRFRAARAAAVETLRAEVASRWHPDSEAITDLAAASPSQAALLGERVRETLGSDVALGLATATAQQIRAATPLFAEIDADLEVQVTSAIAAALGEYWRQQAALRRFDAEGAQRAGDIASVIEADLAALARSSGLPYGVFPAIARQIPARAAALERQKFIAHIRRELDEDSACPVLPPAAVLAAARAPRRQLPETFAEHLDVLATSLRPALSETLLGGFAASVATEDRTEFVAHLGTVLAGDEELAAQFDAAVRACVAPPLRDLRTAEAAAELTERQPTIADYSLELGDEELIALALRDDDISVFPEASGAHLEETRELHAARVAELMDEAVTSLRAQELLTRAEERRLRFVRAVETDPNRTADRKQHYQQEYEAEVLEAWLRNRHRVLLRDERGALRHPEKYGRIFPTTAERIDEIITLEFERPEPTATPAPTAPPPLPPTPVPTPPQPVPPAPVPPVPPAPAPQQQQGGPVDFDERSGLPQPAEPPMPMPETGGAPDAGPADALGGGNTCEEMLPRCLRAVSICHQSVIQCRDQPELCPQAVARCGEAKFACEPNP